MTVHEMINPPMRQTSYLKVGFLTPSLALGGAERWILTLAKNMRTVQTTAIGCTSTTYHPELCREASQICPVYSMSDMPFTNNLHSPAAVAARVLDLSDIVITWGIQPLAEFYSQCGKPIIDVAQTDAQYEAALELCKHSWQGATHLAAVSAAAATAFPERVREQVTVLYNGADMERVAPRRGRVTMRKQHGFDSDARVVLFLSRMVELKHPELVLYAVSELPENWHAVFVGEGHMKEEIRKQASRLLPGRFRIFPTATHVGDYFAMADVFCLPSESEGFPNVWIESWLAGVPSVVTPFWCVKEMFDLHGELAYVAPERPSPAQLAEVLQQAVDAGRDSELVHRARSVAWNNYTASAMCYRWETYLSFVQYQWQQLMLNTPGQTSEKAIQFVDSI